MSEYIVQNGELYHYGVPGMKWGERKAQKYSSKAKAARDSAKAWDAKAKSAKSKGQLYDADRYSNNAKRDRSRAAKLDTKAQISKMKSSKEFKTDVKEYGKLVSSVQSNASRVHNLGSSEKNINRTVSTSSKVSDFRNSRIKAKGSAYMEQVAMRAQTVSAIKTVAIAGGVLALTAGANYAAKKFGL